MPRDGSLASHEIRLSGESGDEDDEGLPSLPTSKLSAACNQDSAPNSHLYQHGAWKSDTEPPQPSKPGRKAPNGKPARRNGPAAALSSQVVSAAKRRTRQALPPAVAAIYAAPTEAHSALPAPRTHLTSPAEGPSAGAPDAAAGGVSQQPCLRQAPVRVVPLLALVLAVVAGATAAAMAALALPVGAPHIANAFNAPSATPRLLLSRTAGGATDKLAPIGGAAAGGAGAPSGGGWLSRSLPYLTGRTTWRATTTWRGGTAPVTAAAAATTSWAGAKLGSVVGLMRRPSGRRLAPAAGGGGGGSGIGVHPSVVTAAVVGGGGGVGGLEGPAATPPPPPMGAHEVEWRESSTVRVIAVVSDRPSPYRTSWTNLVDHTAQRLEWTDPGYQMVVFRQEQLGVDPGLQAAFLTALEGRPHLVSGFDVSDPGAEVFLRSPGVASKLPGLVLFAGGSESLSRDLTRLQGGLRPQDAESWRTALARRLTWTPDGRGLAVWDTVQLLLGRHDSDNFLFMFLVLINEYVTTVRQVADTTKGFDLQSLLCMIKNCGQKVVGCVQDLTCKSALDCLNSCTFNDQVCQYRCIVSYESPLLEKFSLCILQLHNCRNLNAQPPRLPDPAPMLSFRGAALTHEAAEDLFIGWLDEPGQGAPAGAHLGERRGKRYSWLVAGGKNPAYDYFPCQHQLYYRGRGSGQMWYEPVFKAITLDGREVWRRRVYRVRRGKIPGTFHLSVLDNGVTSNEFWRILDCDKNLEYCLFYYSGAASAAGLSYSGAVLGTPDGRMPGPQHTARLHAALHRAGIEPWELSYVDNSNCGDEPLRITGPVAAPAAA